VGNRKEHEKNGQLFTNTVDSMNRYAASYNGSLALDYDPRGNTTQYGDLDLTYDVYGKVVGAEEPAMTAVYLYDASDRRVMSQVNGYATYFVLDGNRVLQEVDGNSAQVTKEYVWGSAIDELVILQLDGEIYHAHADALGSTALLTDATGDIVERYDYNPFGACVATDVNGGGLVGNPYRFTGRRLESETGLYYYRARHYTPEMGRFLSRDPIGIWGDGGNFGNAYAYAGNNPLTYTDPSGEWGFASLVGAVVGAVVDAAIEVTTQLVTEGTVSDWGSVGKAAIEGAVSGAISGGVSTIKNVGKLAKLSLKLGEEVIGGAAAETTSALVTGGEINAGEILTHTTTNLVSGALGEAGEKALKETLEKGGNKALKSADKAAEGASSSGDFTADLSNSNAKSRSGQRNAGNKQLNEAMQNDSALGQEIENNYGSNTMDSTSTSN